MSIGGVEGGSPIEERIRLMASELPLMYSMVVEVVTVGACDGDFRLRKVREWQWINESG